MAVTRHTKIIATLGPSSAAPAVLEVLVARGVDVFRLNFSHGTHESHGQTYRAVREAAARAGRHVAILQDLSGPKIRTGLLLDGRPIDLHKGDELRLAAGDDVGGPGRVFTRYAELSHPRSPGRGCCWTTARSSCASSSAPAVSSSLSS